MQIICKISSDALQMNIVLFIQQILQSYCILFWWHKISKHKLSMVQNHAD